MTSWQGHGDHSLIIKGSKPSKEVFKFAAELIAKQYQPKKVDTTTEYGEITPGDVNGLSKIL